MSIDKKASDNIRRLVAATVQRANSGHPGGSMGGADFIHILFSEFLVYNPDDPNWDLRDRFFLDPGHMSAMLYSAMTLAGIYSLEDLKNFRQWDSVTPGHPERDLKRGIENTSGPLGQGHTIAVGASIAAKFLEARFGPWLNHNIFAFISDGGIQEEISQATGRLAGHLGLGNLVMYYDSNGIQLSSKTEDVTSEDVEAKYKAWGWEVFKINGHNHDEIRKALKAAINNKLKPTLIIGQTVIGHGAIDETGKSLEGSIKIHGAPLGEKATKATVKSLGGNPDSPFEIDVEVKEIYQRRRDQLKEFVAAKENAKKFFEKSKPELFQKYTFFLSGKVPEMKLDELPIKANNSTRAASGLILEYYASKIENMIVCSADLSNSDKTDGFLKKSKIFKKGDFTGGFLQIGVAELTMGAILCGMAIHGGVIPVGGTFFVFSDYMKPAVRLASLMGLPIKLVWTHDSFRVGEDGPTHQPVEHEAQLRLLESMKTEHGEMAIVALRPADSAETITAWDMALKTTNKPCALILSRQDIKDIPAKTSSRIKDSMEISKGLYIVSENNMKPDIILLANGSELSLCEETAHLLRSKHSLSVRVVSAISEGLFRNQSSKYQESILPVHIPCLGVTAGLPQALTTLVGPLGEVHGLKRFGASAPYQVLDQKFGFTVENIETLALKLVHSKKDKVQKLVRDLQG